MHYAAVVALLSASLASAATTGGTAVTSAVAPNSAAPSGCSPNYSGTFQIGPVNVSSSSTSKRDLPRSPTFQKDTTLGITLVNGILTDPLGRTGYIASNEQFQFDGPPQAGAIYTAGFSVCENGSLALGNDAIWWSCLSGTFYNLYFEKVGAQCIESYIYAYGVDGGHYEPASGAATYATTSTASVTSSTASVVSTTSSVVSSTTTTSAATKVTTSAVVPPPSMKTTSKPSSSAGGSSETTSAASTPVATGAAVSNAAGVVLAAAGGLAAFAAML